MENTENWMKSNNNSDSRQLSFDFSLRPAENTFLTSYSDSNTPVRASAVVIIQCYHCLLCVADFHAKWPYFTLFFILFINK